MKEQKQKVSQIRKREILNAAKSVFLRKGFADTVMEDIITETSLSRGGVYYHYKNKVEILHDLMREGIAYRVEKINEFLKNYSGEFDTNAAAQIIVDKALDENELMSVYAIYLQAKRNNEELRNLFPILVEESLEATRTGVKGTKKSECEYITNDFLIFFINTIILGCEILDGARDSFINNREFFVEIVALFFDRYKKGSIK
ncbi:MAG: TetR/AcrR family transcriptional regulator [Ndongobacter sp.]|nr:TetR/AcrR family transcriptional regulator [Ndongobacter sp.]